MFPENSHTYGPRQRAPPAQGLRAPQDVAHAGAPTSAVAPHSVRVTPQTPSFRKSKNFVRSSHNSRLYLVTGEAPMSFLQSASKDQKMQSSAHVAAGDFSRRERSAHIWIHTGRSAAAEEKQPTGRGPEGCVENGSAASLLVSHVQHQFDVSPRKPTRYLQTSNWCWMLLPHASRTTHFDRNKLPLSFEGRAYTHLTAALRAGVRKVV